jgi:hypothetical protein
MKKVIYLLSLLLLFSLYTPAQIVYHNINDLPLLGKATNMTSSRYTRLPDSLKNKTRTPVWNLSQNSAGLALRFSSNSTTIVAQWTVLLQRQMNHMTPTGIRGLDLYSLEGNKWYFVGSGRPGNTKENKMTIVSNMSPKQREYLLYLPLYDGVTDLKIGIDSTATLSCPNIDLPKREKPIVFYGTSILQGGCASRPGMAHTNILSRWLNRETINLGFSGNGLLDLEVAHVIASVDAGMFVLDFVPNANVQQMNERMIAFYRIIRKQHPKTPILFIEDPRFPQARLDERMKKEVNNKNATLNKLFNQLKKEGEKKIYLLSSEKIIGLDKEATVDGIHFTDLGFMRYAKQLYPILKKKCLK